MGKQAMGEAFIKVKFFFLRELPQSLSFDLAHSSSNCVLQHRGQRRASGKNGRVHFIFEFITLRCGISSDVHLKEQSDQKHTTCMTAHKRQADQQQTSKDCS